MSCAGSPGHRLSHVSRTADLFVLISLVSLLVMLVEQWAVQPFRVRLIRILIISVSSMVCSEGFFDMSSWLIPKFTYQNPLFLNIQLSAPVDFMIWPSFSFIDDRLVLAWLSLMASFRTNAQALEVCFIPDIASRFILLLSILCYYYEINNLMQFL